MKFEQYHLEIQYVYKVFCAIHKKFLTAIDHIDYHPSQQHNRNTIRVKEVTCILCMDDTIHKLEG